MIQFLALVAALSTSWAHLRARPLDERGLRRWLGVFALAVATQALLLHLAAAGRMRLLLLALAAFAGLVSWLAISRLVAVDWRGRDIFPRLPLLVIAGFMLAGGRWQLAAWLAWSGTLSYRWRSRFRTVRLFQLGLAAVALAAIAFTIPPVGRIADLARSERPWLMVARATALVAGFHALFGAVVLFGAFVRDPSLGIRRVGWRLALSHLLVVLVPLALLSGMWVSTTVLGVNQDHAQVAARALAADADRLRGALGIALEAPGTERARLETIAALHARDWPRLRLWQHRGTAIERVAGAPLAGDQALAGWLDSLSRMPSHGVVRFADSLFVGAAAGSGAAGAIGLIPLQPVLDSLGHVVQAHLDVAGSSRGNTPGGAIVWDDESKTNDEAQVTRDDSLELARARKLTRALGVPDSAVRVAQPRRQGRSRLVVGADTFATRPRSTLAILTQGYVLTQGIAFGEGGWKRWSFLLSADHPPSHVLSGIFELSRANPFSYLPVVLLTFVGFLFFVIALWDVVMVTNMARSITSAIEALRRAAEKLRAGDLAHRIEVKGHDDLWDVAGAFNLAAEGLARGREMEKEQDRIENELQVARRIQARLLPSSPPEVPGLEIAGLYEPAREVGGDYFDHLALGDGRVLLVIADVSGKSVPAALIMSAFRSALISQDLPRIRPAALAERLNQLLHASLDPGKFVTAFLAFLDGASGRIEYVNAGHNPPVLMRRDRSHEVLERGGTILGILPSTRYEQGEAVLGPGELIALYTDGVSEGANAQGEQWGDARLLSMLAKADGRPCAELAREIAAAVRAFEGEQGATDDITLVIARRCP